MGSPPAMFFFRPTPYGFRQVVQHVSKHVAFGINWLIKSRKGRCCSGRQSKLVEDRYIVLCTVTFIRKQTIKHRETTQQNTKNKNQHTQKANTNTNHQAVTWQLPVYGWKSMLTQAHRNKQQDQPQNHNGPLQRVQEAMRKMRKPGIPPARIPEITKSSHHGMTFTLTLWSKHRQCRVATKVVRKTTAVKQESKTRSNVKITARLRHSGHTQSPLSGAFRIIMLASLHCHERRRLCALFQASVSKLRLRWAPLY